MSRTEQDATIETAANSRLLYPTGSRREIQNVECKNVSKLKNSVNNEERLGYKISTSPTKGYNRITIKESGRRSGGIQASFKGTAPQ